MLIEAHDRDLRDRAWHFQRSEERARGLRILRDEIAHPAHGVESGSGQGFRRGPSERRRNRVENGHQPMTGTPAAPSSSVSAINGSPMSDVGSSVSIRRMIAMPRPSALALPAQS